jgi:sulfatase maturation enzyme AslB (radical SAM superfamily)
MIKDYNTERDHLIIKEYGRNVQKMINYALGIEDKAKRTRLAYIIVSVMEQLNPSSNPNDEYYLKLWNHLNIISGYKIDVEFPYEVMTEDAHKKHPDKIPYNENQIRFRFYGRNMENALKEIAEMEEGEDKAALLKHTANQLKIRYITWNKDIINDEQIASHILHMTNGKLLLPTDVVLTPANDILKQVKAEEAEMEAKAKAAKRKPVKKTNSFNRKKMSKR